MHSDSPITGIGFTRLSSKGQVVIPSDMREQAGIDAGTEFTITLRRDGTFELTPKRHRPLSDMFGMLHIKGRKPMSVRDMDKAIGDWLMADHERILRQSKPRRRK